jgi:hypothetical protein
MDGCPSCPIKDTHSFFVSFVFFWADDYRAHTSCVTEVERYEQRDPSKRKKKKQSPQEVWMELLSTSVALAPTHLQSCLSTIATYDNVPRKEKQFRNFVANSMKLPHSTVTQIWEYLKQVRETQQATATATATTADQALTQQEDNNKRNTHEAVITESKNDSSNTVVTNTEEDDLNAKKNSCSNKNDDTAVSSSLPSSKEVKKTMKKLLKQETSKSMSMKQLRKAVCAKYKLKDTNKKGQKHIKQLVKEHCGLAGNSSDTRTKKHKPKFVVVQNDNGAQVIQLRG